jgi:hypothetical protein
MNKKPRGPLNQFRRLRDPSQVVRLAGQVNPSIQLFGSPALLLVKPQPENDRVLVKADRLTLTAGKPPLAN